MTTTSHLDRLLSFLGADPQNPALLIDAIQAVLDSKEAGKGAVLLAHMEKYGVPEPVVAAHATLLALHLQDYTQAASLGETALAGGIDDQAIRFNTAYAHLYLGNPKRVAELLNAENTDCHTDYLLLKARALHHLEQAAEAEKLLRIAIDKSPDNAEALGLLALLLEEDGHSEEAMRLADKALSLVPKQMEALLTRADHALENQNSTAAHQAYESIITLQPKHGRAWAGLGQIAFSAFDFVTAEKYLKEAVQHMPNHIGTWHVLAWIYILQNQTEKAREALLKSYALDRNFGDTHGGLAVVDAMEGKEAEARTGIRKALKLAPDGMAAHYAELVLLEKSGNTSAALELVNTVLNQPVGTDGLLRRTLVERKLKEMQGQLPRPPATTH